VTIVSLVNYWRRELAPLEMDFTRQSIIAPVEPECANLRWHSENFTSNTGQFTTFTDSTGGTFSFTGGRGQIVAGSSATRATFARTGADIAMPQVWVELEVTSVTVNSATDARIGIGIGKDGTNRVHAWYNAATGVVSLSQRVAGSSVGGPTASVTLTAPFRIALAYVGKHASAWTNDGSGWVHRVGWESPTDLQGVDLTGWQSCVGSISTGGTGANFQFDNLLSSRAGAENLRDPVWVIGEDGTPVNFAGKMRFLATCVTRGAARAQSFQGVWELDPADWSAEMVGVLCAGRNSGIYCDTAGQLIQLADNTWAWALGTWGNRLSGVGTTAELKTYRGVTATNISSGAHALVVSVLNLDTGSVNGGTYDAMMLKHNGTWKVAHTIVDPRTFAGEVFFPSLSETSDFVTFTQIGEDAGNTVREGTSLVVTNGDLWLLTFGRATGDQDVYDGTMTLVGSGLAASPAIPTAATNPSWCAIAPWENQQVMLTFDATGISGLAGSSMGQMWVYTSPRYT